MGRVATPNEVFGSCDINLNLGETVKIKHLYRGNGDICSKDKDPALSITRTAFGWIWNCFRCSESGFISLDQLAPSGTVARIKKEMVSKKVKDTTGVSLPSDFISLDSPAKWSINQQVFKTMKSSFMDPFLWEKYNFGWSDWYKRLIMPVYDFPNHNLLGWVGKDYKYSTKEDRQKNNTPKYLTRKAGNVDRLLYHIPADVTVPLFINVVVIVEDIISAIRVHSATGCESIALLGNYTPESLPLKNTKKRYIVWLDPDMWKLMNDLVHKLTSWGIRATYINLDCDPKEYVTYTIYNQIIEATKKIA